MEVTESYRHLDYKFDLYYAMIGMDENYAEVEKKIGRTRTDVFTDIGDRLVAIEIQHTRIPIKSILRRMKYHTEIGAHTLWIITPETINYHKGIRNLNWIMFIQRLQNGIVFLPGKTDQTVIPARIDNMLRLTGDEITAGRKWLDCQPETEITKLTFEKNVEFGLNVSSYPDWFTDNYLEFVSNNFTSSIY